MKPCIYCAEQIQDAARLCRYCGREQAEARAETVFFEGSVGHVAYLGEYVLYGLLSLLVVGLPFLAYRYMRTVSERWRISSVRIECQRGVLAKKVDSLDLWRVKDITYEQTLSDRLVGDGCIKLMSNDTSDPMIALKGLPDSRQLYERLREAVAAARREQRVLAVDH